MAKRINIVLQDETIKTVEQAAKPGERSRFIDRAVRYYASTQSASAVAERLEAAAIRDRDLIGEIARDWFAVDQQAWQTVDRRERAGRRPHRSAVKSI